MQAGEKRTGRRGSPRPDQMARGGHGTSENTEVVHAYWLSEQQGKKTRDWSGLNLGQAATGHQECGPRGGAGLRCV